MTTYNDLRAQIRTLLGDTDGTNYVDALCLQAANAALIALLPWVYKAQTADFTGDGTKKAFDLPLDFYRLIGAWDEVSGYWLPEMTITPGVAPGDDPLSNQDWNLFPEGKITFANPLEDDKVVTLYYGASWTVLADGADDLEPPAWTHYGILLYACSWATLKTATDAANIRQYNISIDSGTPVMNPMKDMSEAFKNRFVEYMNSHPAKTRGAQ